MKGVEICDILNTSSFKHQKHKLYYYRVVLYVRENQGNKRQKKNKEKTIIFVMRKGSFEKYIAFRNFD